LLGFAYLPWLDTIAWMGMGAIAGTALGTRLRHWMPQRNFLPLFRLIVSVLALRMMVFALVELTA